MRALLVDDDHELARLLRDYLGPHGVSVDHVEEGAGALERIASDGRAVRHRAARRDAARDRRLRGLPPHPRQPRRAHRHAHGARRRHRPGRGPRDRRGRLPPKPFNPRELLARMRAVLRRAHSAPASRVRGAASPRASSRWGTSSSMRPATGPRSAAGAPADVVRVSRARRARAPRRRARDARGARERRAPQGGPLRSERRPLARRPRLAPSPEAGRRGARAQAHPHRARRRLRARTAVGRTAVTRGAPLVRPRKEGVPRPRAAPRWPHAPPALAEVPPLPLVLRRDRAGDGDERSRGLDHAARADHRRRGPGAQRGRAPRAGLGRRRGDARLRRRGARRHRLRRAPRARSAPPACARAACRRARRGHRAGRPAAHLRTRRAGRPLEGALEMERFGPRAVPWAWWRFGLALVLVVVALSTMAGGSPTSSHGRSSTLPTPRIASAAATSRVRTDLAGGRRRWVAQEVRDVAVSFNRMADRIEAMVRGQRELLGAISHELRSPLARAGVALEIARDRLPEAAVRSARSPVPRSPEGRARRRREAARGGRRDPRRPAGRRAHRPGRSAQRAPRPSSSGSGAASPRSLRLPSIDVTAGAEVAGMVLDFDPALLARAVQNLLVNARAHGHPPDRPIDDRRLARSATASASSCATAARASATVLPSGPSSPSCEASRRASARLRGPAMAWG